MTLENELREYIAREFRWDAPSDQLADDHPLIDSNVIDSLALFEIVSTLETRYGIEVDDDDLVAENFATISSIADYVRSRRPG